MQLDDTGRCIGLIRPNGRAIGFCSPCDRPRNNGPQMKPAAVKLLNGDYFCAERRYSGAHIQTVPANAIGCNPANLGVRIARNTTNGGIA